MAGQMLSDPGITCTAKVIIAIPIPRLIRNHFDRMASFLDWGRNGNIPAPLAHRGVD
jgi:hypothetical protein